MKDAYLAVAGRIRQELEDIERIVERTQQIWQQAEQSENDYLVDAVALNLHGFYAALGSVRKVSGIGERVPVACSGRRAKAKLHEAPAQ